MYKSLLIDNFRGFRHVEFEAFRRINLITGSNNVGKTAALEALFLHSGAYNPELASLLNALRGLVNATIDLDREQESPWDTLFHNFRSTREIKVSGDVDDSGWEIRLNYVTDQTEIGGLKLSVRQTYERATAQSSRPAVKVLKLSFRRAKSQQRNYFL